MSTRQDTPPIGRLLREKRDGGYKSVAAKALGVSRQAYDAWESGHHVPGDEWAQTLSEYLDLELRDTVWFLYQDRLRGAPSPDPASPLSLDLGQAGFPRYVKLQTWVDRPTDNRPPNREAA